MQTNNITIEQHFSNLKVALTMALQRGVFTDFDTAIAIKASLDYVEQYLKLPSPLAPKVAQMMPANNEPKKAIEELP